jgi:Flp pilus assembly protein TadG
MVEFSLAFSLMLTVLSGVWQFGYTFYHYNRLATVVRDGARYASLAAYDAPNGTDFHSRVKNMTVYGEPNPAAGATPLVPGLSATNVTVTEQKNGPMPTRITVRVDNLTVDTFFRKFVLNGKPICRFDYTGQLITP